MERLSNNMSEEEFKSRTTALVVKKAAQKTWYLPDHIEREIKVEHKCLEAAIATFPASRMSSMLSELRERHETIALNSKLLDEYMSWIDELIAKGELTFASKRPSTVTGKMNFSAAKIQASPVALSASDCRPPGLGELILALLYRPEKLEGVLGDMEEGYRVVAARRGRGSATAWYYLRVAKSALPFIVALVTRIGVAVIKFRFHGS